MTPQRLAKAKARVESRDEDQRRWRLANKPALRDQLSEDSAEEVAYKYFTRIVKYGAVLDTALLDNKKTEFLFILSQTYSKDVSMAAVGISQPTLDRWLTSDMNFVLGYNSALGLARGTLKSAAYTRACKGSDALAAKFIASFDEAFKETPEFNQFIMQSSKTSSGANIESNIDIGQIAAEVKKLEEKY